MPVRALVGAIVLLAGVSLGRRPGHWRIIDMAAALRLAGGLLLAARRGASSIGLARLAGW